MHFLIEPKVFSKKLANVQSITGKKTTLPVLNHILLSAGNNQLCMIATDLDMVMTQVFTSDVKEAGKCCVPSGLIFDIVRYLDADSPIEAVIDANRLILTSKKVEYKIPVLSADDFPDIENIQYDTHFEIKIALLKKLIDETYFCMSSDESRYQLNGLYFHMDEKGALCCASTDAHRLAVSQAGLHVSNMSPSIVGRKTVTDLRRIIESFDSDMNIDISKSFIQFSLKKDHETTTLSSRLIDGRFPDYKNVLAFDMKKTAVVQRDLFERALARMAIVTDEKTRAIELKFMEDNTLMIHIDNKTGFSKEVIPLIKGCGDFSIKFNVEYLLEIAKQIDCPTMQLLMGDAGDQLLIQKTDQDDTRYVIMPLVA